MSAETGSHPDREPKQPRRVVRNRDGDLIGLWSTRRGAALHTSTALFEPDLTAGEECGFVTAPSAFQIDAIAHEFLQLLVEATPRTPDSPNRRYDAVTACLSVLLERLRRNPFDPFIEDRITIALRPVRTLEAGGVGRELFALLIDDYRGAWDIHLTRVQRSKLHGVIAVTIAHLPPDQLDALWFGFADPHNEHRECLLSALDILAFSHAVPSLLYGLERTNDHWLRTEIVMRLEKISDERALPLFLRLRQETASLDWTLSRLLARAIRVIEHQNREGGIRTLLRAGTGPEASEELLRTASPRESADPNRDETLLLRSPAPRTSTNDSVGAPGGDPGGDKA